MVSDYKEILSDSAKGMKRSAIRELLKLTQKPEIISFAGGLPAKESFPLEQLQEICAEVIATDGAAACQYRWENDFHKTCAVGDDRQCLM